MRLLCLKLKELVNWEKFASNLGIKQYEIDIIKKNNPLDIEGQKRGLFDLWLRKDTTASWKKVEKALSDSDETVLAKKISLYMLQGDDQEEENSEIPELPQVPNKPLPLEKSTEEDTDSPEANNNTSEAKNNTSTGEGNKDTSEGTCNNWQ